MLTSQKICLITNRYPAHPDDVASPFVRDFHLGLKEKGVDVSVFTPLYHAKKTEYTDDVVRFHWRGGKKVVGSLNFFNPKELFQFLSFLKDGKCQLLEHLKRTNPNFCLALWALPSGWFAYQAKKELGIPYSVWCLGSDIYVWAKKPVLRKIIRKVLQEADYLFADGFDLRERVEKLSGKSCLFLPSIRRLPQASEKKRQSGPAKFNFLYVGRWERKKGLDDLLKAFGLVKSKSYISCGLPSVNLYILGWGGFEKKMKKLIKELKLEDEVKIVGKVSTKLVADYIKQADCVTIPSKSDSIPLVFSEALQMGTPLIVTDVGDMGRLVKRYRLGKVIPPGDIKRLAQAIIEFTCEKKDYSKNIPEALKLLNIEKAVDDYLKTVVFTANRQEDVEHIKVC
ncbi:MAG: glycosyltransferase [candidate division Zixibacteria bacterium]|nr:glycosyltransferase [candidate division Zixibacteria bacterium]